MVKGVGMHGEGGECMAKGCVHGDRGGGACMVKGGMCGEGGHA